MASQRTPTFADLGLLFQHGYVERPVPGLAQTLWFRVESGIARSTGRASTTLFWLETASGAVHVFRLTDLDSHPESLVPHFATAMDNKAGHENLTTKLQTGWLFPPDFAIKRLAGATFQPDPEHIREAMESVMRRVDRASPPDPEHLDEEDYDEPGLPLDAEAFLPACRMFHSRLSPDMQAMFERHPACFEEIVTTDQYNALVAWIGISRRNRLQVLNAFPWLVHEIRLNCLALSSSPRPESVSRRATWREVLRCIDAGRPLLPALAAHFAVQRHTLRHAGRRLSHCRVNSESLPLLLWLLDGMKPDKRPTSKAEFNHLRPVMDWLSRWNLDTDREFIGVIARTLFADGIDTARRRLARWCPSHRADAPYDDTEDFVDHRINPLTLPLPHRHRIRHPISTPHPWTV